MGFGIGEYVLDVECQHIVDKNMCHDIVDNVL
jgi:hypothetical protein